ncbi:MAG: phage holin family protein [candidate division Zixibacteria bacterium]|nr:phage holin family protein [candidate division Zixibacteria bacterium]
MKDFLIKWLINTVAVAIVVKILPGLYAESLGSLLLTSLVLGVLGPVLRVILIFFTLPLFILTFGLLYFIINGFILYFISGIIPGFEVSSFWMAFLASLLISLIVSVLNVFFKDKDRVVIVKRED